MSYEPTNWKSGDVVTSAKLNKLEQGVADAGGGGVLVVEYIQGDENDYINATAKELIDALGEGKLIFLKHNEGGSDAQFNLYERQFISSATKIAQTGEVSFSSIVETLITPPEVAVTVWRAATENDKPVADYGE